MSKKAKVIEIERTCIKCESAYPISEFRLVRGRPDTRCKSCVRSYMQRWAAKRVKKEPRYYADRALAGYHALKGDQRKFLFQRLGQRAALKGIEFTLTLDDIFIPEFCPVLGLRLTKLGRGQATDATPSADRIDTAKGYVAGNVVVMSLRANRIKNNGSAADHERVATWMRAQGLK